MNLQNLETQYLKAKVAYYEGNIKDIDEGKELLNLYKDRMKLVRSKINNFKREALNVRISAQQELDRVKSQLGNNGFFTRSGQPIKVDMQKYEAQTIESIQKSRASQIKGEVEVNVQFVQ